MLGFELDAGGVDGDAADGEVLGDVLDFFLVAAAMEAECRERVGIGLGFGAGEADALRRPQAQELAPARAHLEGEFLVMLELALEGFLAIVEAVTQSPIVCYDGAILAREVGLCAR